MLEYDRINISEEIDVNKTSASKECEICHYWYFKDIGFKYEKYLCNVCHGLMKKAMSFNNASIVYVKGSASRIHFWYMSEDDAINIMNGSNLVDKNGVLSKNFIIIFFVIYKNELYISLSLYPIKYFNELFLPYDTFLETNILLTSIPSILNIFFVFIEFTYFDFFIVEIYAISTHSYTPRKKKYKFFNNNFGIRAVVTYLCFVLIDLLNDYKKCLFS